MEEVIGTFDDLRTVTISFFVAKRPIDELELDHVQFSIDDIPVVGPQHGPLPADQGTWWLLGMFEEGRVLRLHWSFRTGIRVPSDSEVVLAYFPDGRLTKATRFARMRVEAFENYSGDVEIKVVKP